VNAELTPESNTQSAACPPTLPALWSLAPALLPVSTLTAHTLPRPHRSSHRSTTLARSERQDALHARDARGLTRRPPRLPASPADQRHTRPAAAAAARTGCRMREREVARLVKKPAQPASGGHCEQRRQQQRTNTRAAVCPHNHRMVPLQAAACAAQHRAATSSCCCCCHCDGCCCCLVHATLALLVSTNLKVLAALHT
jgi:hypothetical protein